MALIWGGPSRGSVQDEVRTLGWLPITYHPALDVSHRWGPVHLHSAPGGQGGGRQPSPCVTLGEVNGAPKTVPLPLQAPRQVSGRPQANPASHTNGPFSDGCADHRAKAWRDGRSLHEWDDG